MDNPTIQKTKEEVEVATRATHAMGHKRGYLVLRLEIAARILIRERSEGRTKLAIMQEWGLKKRRAEQYIGLIYKLWVNTAAARCVDHATRAVADREEIIRQCMAKEHWRTALQAMDSRDKILGVLNEHYKVEGMVEHIHKADLAGLVEKARNNGYGDIDQEATVQRVRERNIGGTRNLN